MKFICHLLILAYFFSFAFNVTAQEFREIEGKILTADTKEPIPYAAIGLSGSGIGTICDEAGNFEFKIPDTYKGKEICVSALGYKQTCLPTSGFQGETPTIFLKPANIELATVEIKALSATELVKEAIRRIPENYADKPVRYTFYQRQSETLNNKPAYIIESVNETYRKHPKTAHQIAIRKSRGIATSVKNNELMNESWVNVYSLISYDNILDYPDYLHPKKYQNFDYHLTDEELIGKDTAYVISFKPNLKKNGQEVPGIEGRLFLHKNSFAVIRLETRENIASIDQYNNSVIAKATNKACNCTLAKQGVINQISYKQIGKRWYFNSSVGESRNLTSWGQYRNPESSNSILQIVATSIQTENAQEIPEDQRVKSYRNFYSTAPKDMNEAYWQQYNVLPLPDAFKKAQQ